MHSVEVVLDDESDRWIRRQWTALAEAGVPSQARHSADSRGESNRPHVTLALTSQIDPEVESRLRDAVGALPVPITIGGLLVFGSTRFVLARLVVPNAAVLALQAAVMAALPDGADATVDRHGTFAPGRWTAHITLGRRLTAADVGTAVQALAGVPPPQGAHGALTRARRWNMVAKQEDWLTPAG
jgi:2'-5' RNA ligase